MNLELLNNPELMDIVAKIKTLTDLGFDTSSLLKEVETKFGITLVETQPTPAQRYQNTTNEEFLEMFKAYALGKRNLTPETVKQYTRHIEEFLDWYRVNGTSSSVLHITKQEAGDYVYYLKTKKSAKGKRMSKATVNSKHSSVSAFYSYLEDELEILNPHIQERSKRNFFRLVEQYGEDELNIRHDTLNQAEMKELLRTIRETTLRRSEFVVARNHLLFRLMFLTGLRASEVVQLKFNQIDDLNGTIKVLGKGSKGKGKKKRETLFVKSLEKEFKEYLVLRRQIDTDLDNVFVTEPRIRKGEYIEAKPLVGADMNEYLEKYLNYSNIDLKGRHITNHSLRHSFATMMIYELGYSAEQVKEYCGHSDLNFTLKHYCHLKRTERDDERFENSIV